MRHVKPVQQRHGQHHVYGGPRESDNQPLPPWLGEKGPRIGCRVVAGLLAHHLDVAAKQDQRKTEISFALTESEEARAETEAEGFHLHVETADRKSVV